MLRGTLVDYEAQRAVARALDVSIADVAQTWLQELNAQFGRGEIAQRTNDSLQALEALRSGEMPQYDDFDALFYGLWYQPSHISLAYTVAKRALRTHDNNLAHGAVLEVHDFGAGELAGQFGLAIALAELLDEHKFQLTLSMSSEDSSDDMKEFGRRLWSRFRQEIEDEKRYSELAALRIVCNDMEYTLGWSLSTARWLMALHVAYEANQAVVANALNAHVDKLNPAVVIVSSHQDFAKHAYSPESSGFRCEESILLAPTDLQLHAGAFPKTTAFRKSIYRNIMETSSFGGVGKLPWRYLWPLDTTWDTSGRFSALCKIYVRP